MSYIRQLKYNAVRDIIRSHCSIADSADMGLQFLHLERHVLGSVPFSFEIKVVYDFIFLCEEIGKITFCTTDLGISRSQSASDFIGIANLLTIVRYTCDRLKH